ncbi:hypothetical protein VKT23_011937 [Stygiomarasmius scandens]|uniref:Uncharacterized protein n=1 Tax=Marasmiellus scandens TaxID=2682957 RepID=A0ABR1JBE5_9AGAR
MCRSTDNLAWSPHPPFSLPGTGLDSTRPAWFFSSSFFANNTGAIRIYNSPRIPSASVCGISIIIKCEYLLLCFKYSWRCIPHIRYMPLQSPSRYPFPRQRAT